MANKAIIDAVCAITSDETTLAIARWWEMDPSGRAAKHLDHYLEGSGRDLKVDLRAAVAEDRGVRATLTRGITKGLNAGMQSGVVPIRQSDYEMQDWQYAIGGMNIEWDLTDPQRKMSLAHAVRIWFGNLYRWHPKEARITQCIHQAAERLKQKGARDYWMRGETILDLSVLVPPESATAGSGGSW